MGEAREWTKLSVGGGRTLRTTRVFDTYWRFACSRQELFLRRIANAPPPWTADPILAAHRFTNVYRASDRVSQYLIRRVIYDGSQRIEEVFLRTLLFKLFNRIDTWETLIAGLGGAPTVRDFNVERYARVLDDAYRRGERLYSAAYIMPSPPFGNRRKHRNHLHLIDRMMRTGAPNRISAQTSMSGVFEVLRSYPSLGDFLAFQFTIDLNYSAALNFSEMDFVVAGPGARNGIAKCFTHTAGLSEAEIIGVMAAIADEQFAHRGLKFHRLGGSRPLQLIDCQNLFCEVDKYARVAHPDIPGVSGRTRIKQRFLENTKPLPQFYPPKWGLTPSALKPTSAGGQRVKPRAQQSALSFV